LIIIKPLDINQQQKEGEPCHPLFLLFKHVYAAYETAALALGGAVIIHNDVGTPTFRTNHNYLFLD
jgi:hypothetical protein